MVTLVIVVPLLPAIGHAVNSKGVHISAGLAHLYTFNWLYCFFSSAVLYYVLNLIWPHRTTLIPAPVYADHTIRPTADTTVVTIDGVEKGDSIYEIRDGDEGQEQIPKEVK